MLRSLNWGVKLDRQQGRPTDVQDKISFYQKNKSNCVAPSVDVIAHNETVCYHANLLKGRFGFNLDHGGVNGGSKFWSEQNPLI